MSRRRNRSVSPTVTPLESRRLLSASVTQVDADYVGTSGVLFNPNNPLASQNQYRDLDVFIDNIPSGKQVDRAYVNSSVDEWGLGHWAAYVVQTSSTSAHIYVEPGQRDIELTPGTNTFTVTLYYTDHTDGVFPGIPLTNTINPNARISGTGLSATFNGQQDGQDWTGPYVGVGADGYKDFKLALSNLSLGAYQLDSQGGRNLVIVVTATKTGQSDITWQAGVTPDGQMAGQMTAELMNWTNLTSSATADLFASPTNDLSQGWSIRVDVTYDDPARTGKTDSFTIPSSSVTSATSPTAAMSYSAASDPTAITAHWISQDPTDSGNVHLALDSANPSGTTVTGAILSNGIGTTWIYGNAPGQDACMPLVWDSTSKVFAFKPVRDESGSTLTLRVFYSDGSSTVARLAGGSSDPDLRDKPIATTTITVTTAQGLRDAVDMAHTADSTHQVAHIQLADGTYTLTDPLVLGYAVAITGSKNAALPRLNSPRIDRESRCRHPNAISDP